MKKEEIVNRLDNHYADLSEWMRADGKSLWEYTYAPEKWTVGQHVVHLLQSSQALLKGMTMPHLILRWKFGKNNRPNRSEGDVILRYKEKLRDIPPSMVSPFSKNMPDPHTIPMVQCLDDLARLNKKLNRALMRKSDVALDKFLLPHPLMGRMTLREIMMWNAYHTKHHFDILKEKYGK